MLLNRCLRQQVSTQVELFAGCNLPPHKTFNVIEVGQLCHRGSASQQDESLLALHLQKQIKEGATHELLHDLVQCQG